MARSSTWAVVFLIVLWDKWGQFVYPSPFSAVYMGESLGEVENGSVGRSVSLMPLARRGRWPSASSEVRNDPRGLRVSLTWPSAVGNHAQRVCLRPTTGRKIYLLAGGVNMALQYRRRRRAIYRQRDSSIRHTQLRKGKGPESSVTGTKGARLMVAISPSSSSSVFPSLRRRRTRYSLPPLSPSLQHDAKD